MLELLALAALLALTLGLWLPPPACSKKSALPLLLALGRAALPLALPLTLPRASPPLVALALSEPIGFAL